VSLVATKFSENWSDCSELKRGTTDTGTDTDTDKGTGTDIDTDTDTGTDTGTDTRTDIDTDTDTGTDTGTGKLCSPRPSLLFLKSRKQIRVKLIL
jgi:hypothetical protein